MGTGIGDETGLSVAGRERAKEAIGEAYRDDGDARMSRQSSRRAVADRLTGGDVAQLKNAALEMDDGGELMGPTGLGLPAIEGDARPHQIISVGAAEKDAGRIGETCKGPW